MPGDSIQKENHARRGAAWPSKRRFLPARGRRLRWAVGQGATWLLGLGFGLFAGSAQPALAQTAVPSLVWQSLGPPSVTSRVSGLAVDPRNDSTVFLAAPGGGIWRSDDRGQTWTPQFDSSPTLQVCTLALDALTPDVLYAGTGSKGVYKSRDGGATYSEIQTVPANVTTVEFKGIEPGTFMLHVRAISPTGHASRGVVASIELPAITHSDDGLSESGMGIATVLLLTGATMGIRRMRKVRKI